MARTNKNNQTTFEVRRSDFAAAEVEVTGGFVRYASDKSAQVGVAFGARASAIIAALPVKDRPPVIIAAVVEARAMKAAGHKSGAGEGRIDTQTVIRAGGGSPDAAAKAWRMLARTRTRRTRAAAIVADAKVAG
jgi:hypothetical protein